MMQPHFNSIFKDELQAYMMLPRCWRMSFPRIPNVIYSYCNQNMEEMQNFSGLSGLGLY